MPANPETILYVASGVLVLVGLWLAIPPILGRRRPSKRPTCPVCERPRLADQTACPSCGHDHRTAIPTRRRGVFPFAAGGLLVIASVPAFFLAREFAALAGTGEFPDLTVGPVLPASVAAMILGLLLLGRAVIGKPARGQRRCPRCRCRVPESLGLTCPNCERTAADQRALFRRRRSIPLVLLALAIIAVAQLGWFERRARRDGWFALVPTDALILAMPYLPADWIDERDRDGVYRDTLCNRLDYGGDATDAQRRAAMRRLIAMLEAGPSTEQEGRIRAVFVALTDARRYDGRHQRSSPDGRDAAALVPLAVRLLGDRYEANREDGELATRMFISFKGYDQTNPAALDAMADAVDAHTPELLRMADDGGGQQYSAALALLELGSGPPEVVDVFVRAARRERAWAANSLAYLSRRSESARERIAELLLSDDLWMVQNLSAAVSWDRSADRDFPSHPFSGADAGIVQALTALVMGDDVERAAYASRPLAHDHNHRGAVLERLLSLASAHQERADLFAQALIVASRHGLTSGQVDRLVALGGSESLAARAMAWRTLESVFDDDRGTPPPAHLEAVRGAAAAALETETDEGTIEHLRSIIWLTDPPDHPSEVTVP